MSELSKYVVQVQHKVDLPAEDGELPTVEAVGWIDLPEPVMAAPRTRRRTIIEKALRKHGLEADDGLVVRVLDEASAAEIPVRGEHHLKLRIG